MNSPRPDWRERQPETGSASEVQSLRRILRDVVALSSLPSIWADYDLPRSIQNLTDVLRAALRAYTVCVRLKLPDGSDFSTIASDGLSNTARNECHTAELLESIDFDSTELTEIPRFNDSGPLNAQPYPVYFDGRQVGCFVACYKADVLPFESDRLLLQVASNQVTLLFQRHRDQEERFARRLAEDRLRQTEHRYQQLVQSLPAAVFACDSEGRLTLYNEAAVQLWGQRPNIGEDRWWRPWKTFHPDGSPLPVDDLPMAIALREGRPVRGREMVVQKADGTRAWVLAHPDPIRDESGRVVGAVNMLVQIDEQKQAEHIARTSEARLRQLLSLMPAAVYACDREGRITFYNRRAAELWGREPALNGSERFCACYKVFSPDGTFVPPDRTPMAHAVREGTAFRNVEAVVERPDGSRFTASVNIDPIRDPAGELCGAINVFQDISDRKRTEQALAAKVRQQHAVAQLGLLALKEIDLQHLFDRAVREIARTLEVEYCKVLELLPGGQEVLLRAGVGWKERLVGRATVSAGKESQAGYTLISAHPVIVKDLRKETRFNGPALLHDHKVVSGLSCIIAGSNGPWGVLGAHTKSLRDFTDEDVSFLQAMANLLATSIQRNRAEQQLRESKALLEGQKDAFQAAMTGGSLEEALGILVQKAIELTGGRARAAFYLVNSEGNALHHVVGMHQHYADAVDGYPVSGESMACGLTVHTGEPVISSDVEEDPRWEAFRWLARQHDFRACWSFPVRTKDSPVLGTLAMYLREPAEPTPLEMEVATVIAHAATVIISRRQQLKERERAEQALQKRGERLQLLSDTLGQLLQAGNPDLIVRELFPKVAQHLGADAYFNFMVSEGNALTLHSCAGIPEETARGIGRLEFGQAICGTVAQTREPVHAVNIQHSDYDKASLARGLGLQCYACNPLMVGENLLGTLSFASRTRTAFDEGELQFLRMISQYTAVSLDRLQTTQKLRENQQQFAADADALARLNAVGSRLWQIPTLKEGIRAILEATIAMLGSDFGNIQLLEGGALRIAAQHGFKQDFLDYFREVSTKDESACGRALRSGRPIIIPDVQADDDYAPMREIARSAGYRGVLSMPLRGRDGKLRGMISTHWRSPHRPTERQLGYLDLYVRQAADFIERWEIDQALRQSDERFRAVVNNSTAIIFVKDAEGKYLLVNRCCEELFHVPEQEIIGKTDFDFFPAEVAQQFRENDLQAIRTGRPVEIEELAPREDGLHTYISTKFPLRRTDGSIYGVAGIATDITARKRAEEGAARLAAIVEHSDDAIFSADLDGTITSWNAGAERLFGYSTHEIVGQSIAILVPEGRADEEPGIIRRIARGESVENWETERRRKDGTVINVSLTVSPVKDGRGRIIGASKVARDITDKVRAKEKLEQTVADRTASLREAVEQMEEFSYSVSHDLRGPLRAMNAYAGVLLEDYGNRLDDTARGYLEKIQRSSDRMNRLTQDVLAYSRVARSQAHPETIDLDRLVRDVIHQHTNLQAPAAEIQIAGPLPSVVGHETTLGQSVSNLLTNAVKFVAPGVKPQVRIRAERNGKLVRVWFEDNGIGIRPEHQKRIFNMFERVHPEGRYDGTGIGLTIVRKAVEKMGGKVGVESDGENGSRFWIELPSAG